MANQPAQLHPLIVLALLIAGIAIFAARLVKQAPVTALAAVCDEQMRAHTSTRTPRH